MCGFLIYISSCGDAASRSAAIGRSLETIHHRGPDQTGVYVDGADAVLAFKRLAIIDIDGSDQPLHHADRYVVVFNGEIYNYAELRAELQAIGATFATEGDTEVLAAAYHAWGEGMVDRLRGMYAFVIWDRWQRSAFGARDRFGIKPFNLLLTPTGAYLASEQKALLSFAESTVDSAALSHYLTYQYVPEPHGLLGGVSQLRAGELLRYSAADGLRTHRYWRPVFAPRPQSAEAAQARIRDALIDSVTAHMRADVPVGAFLSSGIDSTAVVAIARTINPELLTFTAALQVDGYSELDVAKESAEYLDVANRAVKVDAQMMMDALPRIVWHLDDPVADPAIVPLYFVAAEAARYVTVVLSGEGADELFCGYPIYREPAGLRLLSAQPAGLRRGMRAISRHIPEGVRGKGLLQRGGTSLEERYYGNARMFSALEKQNLLRTYDESVRHTDVTAPLYAEAAGLDDVKRMQYVDLGTWLPGDILRKADRMSMAHSLEVRVPFLDPAVFDAAAQLPTELSLPPRTIQTKVALRAALRDIVPPAIVARPKLGFPTPIRVWLRDEMYEWAAAILAGSPAGRLIDTGYGRALLDRHRSGDGDQSRKVWTLLVFCLWYEIFVEGVVPVGSAVRP